MGLCELWLSEVAFQGTGLRLASTGLQPPEYAPMVSPPLPEKRRFSSDSGANWGSHYVSRTAHAQLSLPSKWGGGAGPNTSYLCLNF